MATYRKPTAAATGIALVALGLATPAQKIPTDLRKACTERIATEMRAQRIQGLTVAIGARGQLLWTQGFGLADVENNVAATKHTVYRLASISKPITAVAALLLSERRKLDLDAPVQKYVPKFPTKRWPVTTRQLLAHLGGVRHYRGNEVFSRVHYPTVRSALKIFAKDPLIHEPGTKYSYTTYGYNLAGAVVASVAEQKFIDYLHTHVFTPAGMTHTRADDLFAIIPHRAQGYRRTLDGKIRNSHIVDTSNKIPGGGLCGTASDLVRFCIALRQGKLVRPATLDAMWTAAKTRDGTATRYGLGFQIDRGERPRIVMHGGAQPRVRTIVLFRPDEADGVAVAIMCNTEGTQLTELARQLSELVVRAVSR